MDKDDLAELMDRVYGIVALARTAEAAKGAPMADLSSAESALAAGLSNLRTALSEFVEDDGHDVAGFAAQMRGEAQGNLAHYALRAAKKTGEG